MAGFYTYTSGSHYQLSDLYWKPLKIFHGRRNWHLKYQELGTTGSGRKFIGKILNADLIIDEITSHARAAFELNPLTDTIIEIGGQDAKFTLMHNGKCDIFPDEQCLCGRYGKFPAGTGKKAWLLIIRLCPDG